MNARPPRAVVVDNSSTVRAMLVSGLRARGIDVVGETGSGAEALELCLSLAPDVLSLDLMMPGMDGASVLAAMRERQVRIPVVIVSSVTTGGDDRALRLLDAGAVDVLAKPSPGGLLDGFMDAYADRLREASLVRTEALWMPLVAERRPRRTSELPPAQRRLVVIAASTGGPRALQEILADLPANLGLGMLIVQHMPPTFTGQLARRLDGLSALTVREAADGDAIGPSLALLAPGGRHLRVRADRRVWTSDEAPIGSLRPRADLTIEDVVAMFGSRVLLVVLTGMGTDGLQGARAVKANGGHVIVESKQTALVHGMPKAVAAAGLADDELALPELAHAICRSAG